MTRLYHVDAFAEAPFSGNPAAVCLMDAAAPEAWMAGVAAEMNLSETAFLFPQSEGFALRWFTPKREVTLCGHATLASAHVLWEEGIVPGFGEIRFTTMSGVLIARRSGGLVELDFPARIAQPCQNDQAVNRALGAGPIGTSVYQTANGKVFLLELESEAAVRGLAPDFAALALTRARAVAVTSASRDRGYDFISRYFAPAVGINEDPVTGSVHCSLAPYWAQKLGRNVLTGFQASGRGGFVKCRWEGGRVFISGKAVTICKADLVV
jgi:PhzF family phenazine biosynthesis protein